MKTQVMVNILTLWWLFLFLLNKKDDTELLHYWNVLTDLLCRVAPAFNLRMTKINAGFASLGLHSALTR